MLLLVMVTLLSLSQLTQSLKYECVVGIGAGQQQKQHSLILRTLRYQNAFTAPLWNNYLENTNTH